MKERPILFSGEMVRAILDGRKTQTRRVIKGPADHHWDGVMPDYQQRADLKRTGNGLAVRFSHRLTKRPQLREDGVEWHSCPYDADQLWVRETWHRCPHHDEVIYKADSDELSKKCRAHRGWRPSIHMPRNASRVTLGVTGIRVERVQDISEEDAMAEGVNGGCTECGELQPCGCKNPSPDHRDSFIWLWDHINAKRGYGWDMNPWVWVVEFRRVKP